MSDNYTIVYYSLTGNTKAFVGRFEGVTSVDVKGGGSSLGPYLVVTPTYNFGKAPRVIKEFVEAHREEIIGVVSLGNRNWGAGFAKAYEELDVELIAQVELRGSDEEARKINEKVKEMLRWQN